ncbi:Cob(I)yrinic acid a,c-diamide adenosyltransferase [Pseudomonas sp. THAF187a]|uniref:cob(I)yrinic acid a,c-diamide adenosyltransferase n=1 Tax=unclassified Pseudomonas TaxID=196821 RepID=UPI0012689F65|nr:MULTISPECIES: cob(I)yrinic acid a,c-diamide adenosyltransferase [unclassified Pseudomonas]QFT20899.1 Cob(I)yrinic acid a,c-diamide adenosyltransferase [Pseudomonas sp. THAF187a]QFT41088.1 Cob(I)yrinic acid a,c-diamide adenosyltransferase [Pseudomonas sp. THAF42]
MGFRLSKIYTRTGDQGETGLADGRRVGKDHPRIEAIGELDSCNSQLGLLLAELDEASATWPGLREVSDALRPCQHRLFDLGGELAMPDYQALQQEEVERLEVVIDRWNEEVGPLQNFILPGGSRLIAQAHVCRSFARSSERRCQHLNAVEPLRAVGLAYVNRLSDLLFVAARLIARRQGIAEILWQAAEKP